MAGNWLTKLISTPPVKAQARNLPSTIKNVQQASQSNSLPNASIVYGVAAGVFFATFLYFLFSGRWFTGVIILVPAACFLGYAIHFLKYPR